MLRPRGNWRKPWRKPWGYPLQDWTPAQLFASGQQGAWYDPSDLGTLFQDAAQSTPVTADGDPLGGVDDKSPNDIGGSQTVLAARLIYHTDGTYHWLTPDRVDDNLTIPLPDGQYTVLQGTMDGLVEYKINVTGGAGWTLYANPSYTPGTTVTQLIVVDGPVVSYARTFVEDKGSGTKMSGVASMASWFRERTDITEIATGGWDTSHVTNFYAFARGCSSLTTLDVSGWNTSHVTNFYAFAYDCSSLTTLDVSGWNTSQVTTFGAFAYYCSSLTSLDVSGWDTSQVTNFNYFASGCSSLTNVIVNGGAGNPFADSPCTDYANAFSNTNLSQQSIDDILVAIEVAGTSNGTFNQSGGSAPSATGEAAIDALRARGWTVTVTGGY